MYVYSFMAGTSEEIAPAPPSIRYRRLAGASVASTQPSPPPDPPPPRSPSSASSFWAGVDPRAPQATPAQLPGRPPCLVLAQPERHVVLRVAAGERVRRPGRGAVAQPRVQVARRASRWARSAGWSWSSARRWAAARSSRSAAAARRAAAAGLLSSCASPAAIRPSAVSFSCWRICASTSSPRPLRARSAGWANGRASRDHPGKTAAGMPTPSPPPGPPRLAMARRAGKGAITPPMSPARMEHKNLCRSNPPPSLGGACISPSSKKTNMACRPGRPLRFKTPRPPRAAAPGRGWPARRKRCS